LLYQTCDLWSTSPCVKLQTLLCVNGPVMDFLNIHTHIHSLELKYTAAVAPDQFWNHSHFIVHNYVVTYSTKTSLCKHKPLTKASMQLQNLHLLNLGKP
jgi:hypothetical protein